MTIDIDRAIDRAFGAGIYQHRQELTDFVTWWLARLARPIGTVIDIGSHRGGSCVLWCELGADQVISVDLPDGPWGGVSHAAADLRNAALTARYPDQFLGLLGDSRDPAIVAAVTDLCLSPADLVFIDGDHSLAGVTADWDHYGPLGRYVAFHDVNETAYHRQRGVVVSELWGQITALRPVHTFSILAPWGGIGVVEP